jgi:hypothetical protein
LQFKWFPIVYFHGVAYFIDFPARAFREVRHPHLCFGFASALGTTMMEDAKRQ